jgi:predicted transcriptional regulator
MDEERPRKRHTQFSRAARTKRILEQLRDGWAYDDIAREQGLTERRVRQIVAEFIKTREVVGDAAHAHMQIDRLSRAMRVASDALARGDLRAIGPFIRVVDRLDRYQALAQETKPWPTPAEDQLVMQQLVARIRSKVEDELAEERRREAEAAAASAGSAAPEPIGNCAAAVAEATPPPPSAPLSAQAPSDFFRGVR